MRPKLKTASAREMVSGSAWHAAGVARLRSGTTATKARSPAEQQRPRARPCPPPSSPRRAPRTRWPPRSRRTRRSPPPPAKGSSAPAAAAAAAARAAEEPESPGDGYLRAHRDGEAVVAQHLDRHPCGQVRRIVKEPGPLALAVHAQRGGGLHLDAHVAIEHDGQRVEPRSEVGGRRGGPGAHGVRLLRSEDALEERQARHGALESYRHRDTLGAERHHDGADTATRRAWSVTSCWGSKAQER